MCLEWPRNRRTHHRPPPFLARPVCDTSTQSVNLCHAWVSLQTQTDSQNATFLFHNASGYLCHAKGHKTELINSLQIFSWQNSLGVKVLPNSCSILAQVPNPRISGYGGLPFTEGTSGHSPKGDSLVLLKRLSCYHLAILPFHAHSRASPATPFCAFLLTELQICGCSFCLLDIMICMPKSNKLKLQFVSKWVWCCSTSNSTLHPAPNCRHNSHSATPHPRTTNSDAFPNPNGFPRFAVQGWISDSLGGRAGVEFLRGRKLRMELVCTGAGEIQVRPLNKEPGPGLLRTGVDALTYVLSMCFCNQTLLHAYSIARYIYCQISRGCNIQEIQIS